MSDGKRRMKSDVVILSIKPRRPEFPSDKKYVSVKVALREWDTLDAYYRGQIITLQKQLKSTANSLNKKLRKSSCGSGRSSRSTSKRSSHGNQLTELFGDENIDEITYLSSDEENKRPTSKTKKKSRERSNDGKRHKSKHKIKQSPIAKREDSEEEWEDHQDPIDIDHVVTKAEVEEEEENYLSVPRDNFVIEFAIGLKKRTPVPSESGTLNPIKVAPYKPPVAIGFNGVHIQKILYHKSDGVLQTSPTTTAPTPEKPPPADTDSNSSGSPQPQLTDRTGYKRARSSSYNRDNNAGNNGNGTHQNKSPLSIGNDKASLKNEPSSPSIVGNSDSNSSSISQPIVKRKFAHLVTDPSKVSSTTMALSDDSSSCSSSPEIISVKKVSSIPPKAGDEKKTVKQQSKMINDDSLFLKPPPPISSGGSRSPRTKSLSITDKIIKKAKQLPPEQRERERQRRLESQKRKLYALKKNDEQKMMDSIDVSIKAMEMIWTHPLLSPIRSP